MSCELEGLKPVPNTQKSCSLQQQTPKAGIAVPHCNAVLATRHQQTYFQSNP